MNNLRTLLLISVLVIQIPGILTSNSWNSLQLAEFAGKVCQNIKCQTSSKAAESVKDLHIFKKGEIGSVDSPICRKEASIFEIAQPEIITKKNGNIPTKVNPISNQQPARKVSVISNARFIETGGADLF